MGGCRPDHRTTASIRVSSPCAQLRPASAIILDMASHVYLAPHLDDAVFSCGGLIARQTANDEAVTVVTVCAGDTPVGELTPFAVELHRQWGGAGSPIAARRAEDRMAG